MRSHYQSFFSTRRGWQALVGFAALALFAPGASAAVLEPVAPASATLDVLSSADACLDTEEIAFLGLINDHRAMSGLGPLSVSSSLSAASAYHSIDMAEKAYLDHTMVDGTSVQQNMQNFGYQGGAYGENIAAGTDTAASRRLMMSDAPMMAATVCLEMSARCTMAAPNPSSASSWAKPTYSDAIAAMP